MPRRSHPSRSASTSREREEGGWLVVAAGAYFGAIDMGNGLDGVRLAGGAGRRWMGAAAMKLSKQEFKQSRRAEWECSHCHGWTRCATS